MASRDWPPVDSGLGHLAQQTARWLDETSTHPPDAVVLLPYAQLMPLARRAWVQEVAGGQACFMPRFLTTQAWAAELAALQGVQRHGMEWSPQASIAHAQARSLLIRSGLQQALSGQALSALMEVLIQAAQALVPKLQAMAPESRPGWLQEMRTQRVWGFQTRGYDADAGERHDRNAIEPALLHIALEWVGMTRFETDVLWQPEVRQTVSALVVWQGLQTEGLAESLARTWGDAAHVWPWPQVLATGVLAQRVGNGLVRRHEASDAEAEARQASASVIRHLHRGARHVGVVAQDRALVRRMRALLAARGVAVQDETGWKLSTTQAATQVMSWLVAARYGATTHEVLDAAQHLSGVSSADLRLIEQTLIQGRHFLWPEQAFFEQGDQKAWPLGQRLSQWRAMLHKPRSLHDWLQGLSELCVQTGLLAKLQQDDAGQAVMASLHLSDPGWMLSTHPDLAQDRLNLPDFTAWVRAVLEAGSFVPQPPQREDGGPVVSLIPLPQVLGRHWDVLVIPGCDEDHLPWCPPDLNPWTSTQRQQLGLATEAQRIQAQRLAWDHALSAPRVDLFRRTHEQQEIVAASPLLRHTLHALRQMGAEWPVESDNLLDSETMAAPEHADPQPVWTQAMLEQGALLRQLSPSAYEDLRRCPYRFHAHRLLGLREEDELADETDKRDWGNWVHRVLHRFHSHRRTGTDIEAQLDEAAQSVEAEMRLDGAAFLPFRMAWPNLREAYAQWLRTWEREGHRFERGEADAKIWLEEVGLLLTGRMDRIDQLSGGGMQIFDYKTEAADKSARRIKHPGEDVQLAFYALLTSAHSPDGSMQAAYLNLPESGETRRGQREMPKVEAFDLPDLDGHAQTLRQGIVSDVQRIRQGHPLRALGDGPVCEHCDVRGMCRRDFWKQA